MVEARTIHLLKSGRLSTILLFTKLENGVARGGNNWSKIQRKRKTDEALVSSIGVTTPSATRSRWGNQETLQFESPHHTSTSSWGCRDCSNAEISFVRMASGRSYGSRMEDERGAWLWQKGNCSDRGPMRGPSFGSLAGVNNEQASRHTNGRLSLWKRSWDAAFWVWPWSHWSLW